MLAVSTVRSSPTRALLEMAGVPVAGPGCWGRLRLSGVGPGEERDEQGKVHRSSEGEC